MQLSEAQIKHERVAYMANANRFDINTFLPLAGDGVLREPPGGTWPLPPGDGGGLGGVPGLLPGLLRGPADDEDVAAAASPLEGREFCRGEAPMGRGEVACGAGAGGAAVPSRPEIE